MTKLKIFFASTVLALMACIYRWQNFPRTWNRCMQFAW